MASYLTKLFLNLLILLTNIKAKESLLVLMIMVFFFIEKRHFHLSESRRQSFELSVTPLFLVKDIVIFSPMAAIFNLLVAILNF